MAPAAVITKARRGEETSWSCRVTFRAVLCEFIPVQDQPWFLWCSCWEVECAQTLAEIWVVCARITREPVKKKKKTQPGIIEPIMIEIMRNVFWSMSQSFGSFRLRLSSALNSSISSFLESFSGTLFEHYKSRTISQDDLSTWWNDGVKEQHELRYRDP